MHLFPKKCFFFKIVFFLSCKFVCIAYYPQLCNEKVQPLTIYQAYKVKYVYLNRSLIYRKISSSNFFTKMKWYSALHKFWVRCLGLYIAQYNMNYSSTTINQKLYRHWIEYQWGIQKGNHLLGKCWNFRWIFFGSDVLVSIILRGIPHCTTRL